MEELIGKTIARYQILARLGEGGMRAVFKAHDLTLQRNVAIKVMHLHYARQSDFKERFMPRQTRLNIPAGQESLAVTGKFLLELF